MNEEICAHCGGNKIIHGIRVGQHADVGVVGLEYKARFVFLEAEPLLADLCAACGVVVRFRVKNTDRNWQMGDK